MDKYAERKDMVFTKFALSAFFLDPKSDKTKLSSSQLSIVRIFVTSQLKVASNPKAIDQFVHYTNQTDAYNNYIAKTVNALDYWELMKDVAPELSHVAIKLLKIPASTA